MATVVVMPQLGNSVESCLIVSWQVAVGDEIAENAIVCEVETDKASMEVPSSAAGTVLAILWDEGDDVPVKEPLLVVGVVPGNAGEFTFERHQLGLDLADLLLERLELLQLRVAHLVAGPQDLHPGGQVDDEQQVTADHQHVVPAKGARQPFLGHAQHLAGSIGYSDQQGSQNKDHQRGGEEHHAVDPYPLGGGLGK